MTSKLTFAVVASLLIALTSATARAQVGYGSPAYQQPTYNLGQNTYFEAAGTIWGSYLHGYADYLRGEGEYNLLTSQANINNQSAYSMGLDNHKKKIATYFESRQMNRSYREQEKPVSKSTPELAAQWAKSGIPDRLADSQLEQTSGAINWPEVLNREEFAPYRAELENLFHDRAVAQHGPGSTTATAIRGQTSEMKAQLNKLVKELPVEQFTVGRKFIDSLSYEARFVPVVGANLAAN